MALATRNFVDLLGQTAVSKPTVQLSSLYAPLDLSGLVADFSWAKIVSAIDRSPNNKSPGPNGFTNEFYKAFKHVLRDDILRFFADFHCNKVSLDSINSAYITLLPKKDTSLEIRDFTPISLVRSILKLASNVLTNKLQYRIPNLVHPLQSGFLKGRSINCVKLCSSH